jgi:hypothetical protein
VRNVRRRTLHGRKTRHDATWTPVLKGTNERDVGLYSGRGASLPLRAAKDSEASGWLWWTWGVNS